MEILLGRSQKHCATVTVRTFVWGLHDFERQKKQIGFASIIRDEPKIAFSQIFSWPQCVRSSHFCRCYIEMMINSYFQLDWRLAQHTSFILLGEEGIGYDL